MTCWQEVCWTDYCKWIQGKEISSTLDCGGCALLIFSDGSEARILSHFEEHAGYSSWTPGFTLATTPTVEIRTPD